MLPGRGSRAGGLTKTQQLRQAKTAALTKQLGEREAATRTPEEPFIKRRRRIVAEPKKVDFHKPTMTKAMMARVKQAEKFKQEYERKREEIMLPDRKPKRTPAPIGGDARLGKERTPRKSLGPSPVRGSPRTPGLTPRAGTSHMLQPRRIMTPTPSKRGDVSDIADKTLELAKTMNADVVQAEPISDGPIENIIIPPGVVNDNRTTVINVPQSPAVTRLDTSIQSQMANRSIQVISNTLEEQEVTMQNKLEELQQAKREFVMAAAGGDETLRSQSAMRRSPPQVPQRLLYKVPDIEEDMFRIEYQRDHPDIVAAREFAQRTIAAMQEREAAQRMEEEFERLAMRDSGTDELRLDVPFEEELFQEGDISWEEDLETGMDLPCPSRIKASMPVIPKREESYEYESFDPEELERFFDVQRYPACPARGPPPGREQLHPDLWELDDPWYRPPPEPDMPDLIDFS